MLEYFLAAALHAWNGSEKKAERESRHRQAEERKREAVRKAWRAEAAAREKRQRDAEIREQRALLERIEAKLRPQDGTAGNRTGKETQKAAAGGPWKMDEKESHRRAEEKRVRNLETAKARMAEEDLKRHDREEIERLRKERNRLANENARLKWEKRQIEAKEEKLRSTILPPVSTTEVENNGTKPDLRTKRSKRVGFSFTFHKASEKDGK